MSRSLRLLGQSLLMCSGPGCRCEGASVDALAPALCGEFPKVAADRVDGDVELLREMGGKNPPFAIQPRLDQTKALLGEHIVFLHGSSKRAETCNNVQQMSNRFSHHVFT